jgi:hypothetical protein
VIRYENLGSGSGIRNEKFRDPGYTVTSRIRNTGAGF